MTARCYIGAGQGDESEKTYPSAIDDRRESSRSSGIGSSSTKGVIQRGDHLGC